MNFKGHSVPPGIREKRGLLALFSEGEWTEHLLDATIGEDSARTLPYLKRG